MQVVRGMMRVACCGAMGLGLLGCAPGTFGSLTPPPATPTAEQPRPEERPVAAPPKNARTPEQFDTTTPEQRAAATQVKPAGDKALGRTIAALGNPTDPGFWAKTPLVTTVTPGRLENPVTKKSVLVELRPLDAGDSGGSQVSLAALRALEVSLTGLPELVVYAR